MFDHSFIQSDILNFECHQFFIQYSQYYRKFWSPVHTGSETEDVDEEEEEESVF